MKLDRNSKIMVHNFGSKQLTYYQYPYILQRSHMSIMASQIKLQLNHLFNKPPYYWPFVRGIDWWTVDCTWQKTSNAENISMPCCYHVPRQNSSIQYSPSLSTNNQYLATNTSKIAYCSIFPSSINIYALTPTFKVPDLNTCDTLMNEVQTTQGLKSNTKHWNIEEWWIKYGIS